MDNNYNRSRWQESKDKLILSKENRHRHNLRRSVLVYISFEFGYKSSSCSYNVFLLILWSFSLRVFFLFYTIFFPSSSPSTCRLDHWCWSLFHQHILEVFGSSCKVEKLLFKYHFLINTVKELATKYLMRWQQLSLRYFIVSLCPVPSWCVSLSIKSLEMLP